MLVSIALAAVALALQASAAVPTDNFEVVMTSSPDGTDISPISDTTHEVHSDAACRAACRQNTNCVYYAYRVANEECVLISSISDLALEPPVGGADADDDWSFGAPGQCGANGAPSSNGPIPLRYTDNGGNDAGPITDCKSFGPTFATMRARMERRTAERRNKLRARAAAELTEA